MQYDIVTIKHKTEGGENENEKTEKLPEVGSILHKHIKNNCLSCINLLQITFFVCFCSVPAVYSDTKNYKITFGLIRTKAWQDFALNVTL